MIKGFSKVAPERFTAWSPSRLDDYLKCPAFAKYKHLDKLCTICFAGVIKGGYDCPAVCQNPKCGKTIVKGDALVRGDVIGKRLDAYLTGEEKTPGPTVLHSKVKEIVKKAKAEIKKGIGKVQANLMLTRGWTVWTGPGWAKEVWLRAKLDYWRKEGTRGHVTDWKTGGCEKKGPETGKVIVVDKYDDQLLTYQTVLMSTDPGLVEVTSDLVFLDCAPQYDPVVPREGLVRKDLKKAQDKLTKKVLPMLNDTTFAPRSQFGCRWCDYGKAKGGPCKY
jgi:hypothetical protein